MSSSIVIDILSIEKPDSPNGTLSSFLLANTLDYHVQSTHCLEDAISLSIKKEFAVIFIDIALPEFDETDVIFELKQVMDCPIILVAPERSIQDESHRAISKGVSDVLNSTTANETRIRQIVSNSMERHKLEKEKQNLINDLVEASFENQRILDELREANTQLNREITLRTRIEQKNALLIKAIDQLSDEVIISDLSHRAIYRNRAFENSKSATPTNIDIAPIADLFPSEEEHILQEVTDTIASGKEWRGKSVHADANDQPITEQISIFPIRSDDQSVDHYIMIKRDVTRETGLEKRLVQSQKLEAIGQLAAGIAHEINTPTQYVNDNVNFIGESIGPLQEFFAKHLSLIEELQKDRVSHTKLGEYIEYTEAMDIEFLMDEIPLAITQSIEGLNRISTIVQAMKEFSHPSTANKVPGDINKALRNSVQVSANVWKYVADIQFDLDERLPLVPCFLGEINQVFLNLIVNAAHAIEAKTAIDGGEKGVIKISTSATSSSVTIQVEDTGCGIPDSIIDRIFDPFFTTKEVGQGTGQGLSMAFSTVEENHQGAISVSSALNRGTTFTIRLPLHPSG